MAQRNGEEAGGRPVLSGLLLTASPPCSDHYSRRTTAEGDSRAKSNGPLTSRYLPGRRGRAWRKTKQKFDRPCVVIGYKTRGAEVSADG